MAYLKSIGALVGLVLLLAPQVVWALEFKGLGRLKIVPGVGFETLYNDNVFLEAHQNFATGGSEGRGQDTVLTSIVFLNAQIKREPGEALGFDLDYLGRYEDYLEFSELDKFIHDLRMNLNLGGYGGKTDLNLGGKFLDTRNPLSSEFASNLNPRADRKEYKGHINLDVLFSKLLTLQFRSNILRNEFNDSIFKIQNGTTYKAGGRVLLQRSTQLSLGTKYEWQFIDYDEASVANIDSQANTYMGVIIWEPRNQLRFEIEAGYKVLDFDENTASDREDVVYNVAMFYTPSDRSELNLTYARQRRDSTFETIQSYLVSSIDLTYKQKIHVKWSGEFNAGYRRVDYEEALLDAAGGNIKVRKDDRVNTSVTLVYEVQKWLEARTAYQFNWNDSNFDAADFRNNTIMLSLKATF